MQITKVFIVAVFGILALDYSAYGTQQPQAVLAEIASRSDVVLKGTCVSSNSRWDSRTQMILTTSLFKVESYVKGQGANTISVTTPGGVLPERNLMMTFPGMIEFVPGEKALLFLMTNREGAYEVYARISGAAQIQEVQRMISTGKQK